MEENLSAYFVPFLISARLPESVEYILCSNLLAEAKKNRSEEGEKKNKNLVFYDT